MRRSTLGLLVAATLSLFSLLLGASAQAGEITVTYDFTMSTVSAAGTINIPPDGSITAAQAKVRMPGAGISTPSAGPVTLSDLSLSATVDAPIPFANVTGFVIANQLNTPAFGNLTAGLAQATIFPPVFLDVVASLDCAGFLCGAVGVAFPVTLNGVQTINDSLTLMISGLSVSGSAMATGTISLSFNGGVSATIMLVGNEVSRTFDLPEPGQLASLAGGAVGLLGLVWLRRRRP